MGDITGVHRHRMLKGPMFGLGSDFISIEYGERAVNISPKDADDFIKAILEATERPRSPRVVPSGGTNAVREGASLISAWRRGTELDIPGRKGLPSGHPLI